MAGQSSSTSVFGYDDLYRLTSATVAGTSYSWVYDQVGNRTSQTVGGVTTAYTYDSADHLLTVGGASATSDLNGSVTNDGAGGVYTWDVRGRLKSLTKGGSTYAFTYGPDDLRVSKSVNGVLTTYLLDGEQVVTDTINGAACQTLYGPGMDHPLARNGEYFLPNHLNSTTALTDSGGNVRQGYSYGPFGTMLNSPTDSNPFQYTGREVDESGLMYYRARYYNPIWGRFVAEDPLGVDRLPALPMEPAVTDGSSFAASQRWAAAQPAPDRNPTIESTLTATGTETAWELGVRPAGPTWTTTPYAYADDNPITYRDPSGERAPGWLWIRTVTEVFFRLVHGVGTSGRVRQTLPIRPDHVNPPAISASGGRGGASGGENAGSKFGGIGGNASNGGEEPPIGGAPGTPGSGGCFVAGTPVIMADGTSKPIEAVKVGDTVLSRDPLTGQTTGQRVHGKTVRVVRGSILLRFSGGERIETTYEHPFYVPGRGFVVAGKLNRGIRVARWRGRPLTITRIEINWSARRRVYNLHVTKFHTYFVGHAGIWVHNRKGGGWEELEEE